MVVTSLVWLHEPCDCHFTGMLKVEIHSVFVFVHSSLSYIVHSVFKTVGGGEALCILLILEGEIECNKS